MFVVVVVLNVVVVVIVVVVVADVVVVEVAVRVSLCHYCTCHSQPFGLHQPYLGSSHEDRWHAVRVYQLL